MIIGYDGGYSYIKTSDGIMFPSKVTTKEALLGSSANWIIVKGTKYFVGEGENTIDLNKISCELTKVCLLYALSKYDKIEFDVVTGLPIGQYKKQKQELKNFLLENRINKITVNGGERNIIINNAEIFPQAAAAGYCIDTGKDFIIGDIGGRTFDICYFKFIEGKRKLIKYSTILEGTFSLYSDIVVEINQRLEMDLRVEDGEKILKNGLFIYGEKQDLTFLKPIIQSHLDAILKEIIMNYPYKTCKLYLTGGGAHLYGPSIQKKIPGTLIMDNAQFNNAIGYKKVGESLWPRRY